VVRAVSKSEPAASEGAARIPSPLQALLIWFTAALAIVASGFVLAALAAAAAALRGAHPTQVLTDPKASPLVNDATWISVGTVLNELSVLGTLGFWLWVMKTPRRIAFPVGRPSVLGVIGGLLLVFGSAPLAEVMGELMHRLTQNEVTASTVVVNAARSASGGGVVLLVFALGVMPALAEELLFRGLLTAPFERKFWLGLVVPSVLFGLFHLEPTQVAGTIVLGVGFAASRLCTGTLLTSMLVHLVYNTTVVLTVRYSDALVEHQIALTPVLVGVALSLLGAVILWRERRVLVARRAGMREAMPSWWI